MFKTMTQRLIALAIAMMTLLNGVALKGVGEITDSSFTNIVKKQSVKMVDPLYEYKGNSGSQTHIETGEKRVYEKEAYDEN